MNSTTIEAIADDSKIDPQLASFTLAGLMLATVASTRLITKNILPAICATSSGAFAFILAVIVNNENPRKNDIVTAIFGYAIFAVLGAAVYTCLERGLRPVEPVVFDSHSDLEAESAYSPQSATPSLQFTNSRASLESISAFNSNTTTQDVAATADAAQSPRENSRTSLQLHIIS